MERDGIASDFSAKNNLQPIYAPWEVIIFVQQERSSVLATPFLVDRLCFEPKGLIYCSVTVNPCGHSISLPLLIAMEQ
jgi:hypothetical protein